MLKSQNDPIYIVTSGEWSLLARALKSSVFLSWRLGFVFSFVCQRELDYDF